MKKNYLLLFALLILSACSELNQLAKDIESNAAKVYGQTLSETDIIKGLRAALETGTNKSVSSLGKTGGFSSSMYKIVFPPEASVVASKLKQVGLGSLVDNFENKLNQAAESAVPVAKSIFISALKQMTIADARTILMGPKNAATNYFKNKTKSQLYQAFYPKVSQVLNQKGTTAYWEKVSRAYNNIPGVKTVNTDINQYACNKILEALFDKIEKEEEKIRNNPAARSTEILKRVFAAQD